MAEFDLDTLRLPFQEQIAFFRQKLNLPTARWDDIFQSAHDRAFVVAGALSADLLDDLRQAVDRAISQGDTLAEFRRQFKKIVQKNGWHGWTGEGTQAGEAWRTRTIYTTNVAASHAAGRYQQLTDPDLLAVRPYWRYVHNDSVANPREHHQRWGQTGLTLRHDHPFWKTHYPPNGWGCRCRVTAVRAPREGDATEPPAGWDQADPKTGAPEGIDRGWAYAPGASVASQADALRSVAADKLPSLPEPIARQLATDLAAPTLQPDPPAAGKKNRLPVDVVRSTERAHLVRDAAGREAWIQKRWLTDGQVAAATFERSAAELAARTADLSARRAFKNTTHPVTVARETDRAVAVEARWAEFTSDQSGTRLVWFPKSQLQNGEVPGWLIEARARELRDSLTRQAVTFQIELAGHTFWL